MPAQLVNVITAVDAVTEDDLYGELDGAAEFNFSGLAGCA